MKISNLQSEANTHIDCKLKLLQWHYDFYYEYLYLNISLFNPVKLNLLKPPINIKQAATFFTLYSNHGQLVCRVSCQPLSVCQGPFTTYTLSVRQ